MAKFKKRPVAIEATQWWKHGDHPSVKRFDLPGRRKGDPTDYKRSGWMQTLEGNLVVDPGDWIVTYVQGDRYPVKPDIFEMLYERVEENSNKKAFGKKYEEK